MSAAASAETLAELLAATARGDRRAFAALYDAASPHLFGLLLRILKRRDWAEEALQDCFLRVWQRSESYAPAKGAPLAWLSTIARYRALDLLRMRRPEVSEGDENPEQESRYLRAVDETQNPLARAEESQGVGDLERCMQRLNPEQRRSVLLAYYEGYTHAELVRTLRAPLGTVKSWVRRGLLSLRECLEAA